MDIAVRIRHYANGYERLVGLSDYACWCRTEQRIGKPIFQVMGILISRAR